jgi:hypothetical protein
MLREPYQHESLTPHNDEFPMERLEEFRRTRAGNIIPPSEQIKPGTNMPHKSDRELDGHVPINRLRGGAGYGPQYLQSQ